MGSWRRVRRASYVQRRACLFVRNKQSATPIVSQFETLPQSLSAAFGQSLVFYSGKTTMLTPDFPSASLIEASVVYCGCKFLRTRGAHIVVSTLDFTGSRMGARRIATYASAIWLQTTSLAALKIISATSLIDSNKGGVVRYAVTRPWWFKLRFG